MIAALKKIVVWLEKTRCNIHFKWNAILENLKTDCQCEKLQK
jgi:hypothetical protein